VMKKQVIDSGYLKEQFAKGLKAVQGLLRQGIPEAEPAGGLLGLDIGTDSVKIARLDTDKQPFVLLGYAVEKIDQKNVRDTVSRAIKKSGASQEEVCVLSLSGQGVVSRYVELPLMSKAELESSMKFEIEKYVPFPLAEVSTDYAVAGEMKDKAKTSILIAAAKNDLVGRKAALAQELSLKVKALDLDALALANFYTEIVGKQSLPACYAVINIGRSNSNMNILVEGRPFLSRDIFIGGEDLTKKISEVLEIDMTEAEALKFTPGLKEEAVQSAMEPVLGNLASEIRVSLDYFESRGNRSVDKVFMTGGTSRLRGLREYLEHALAVDVEKMDFTDRLKLAASIDAEAFKAEADLLAVSLGLALRTEK